MITILLRQFGIDLMSFFSIYSVIGLIVVYLYFQVPLMIVLMLPAFAGAPGRLVRGLGFAWR